ncbi:MAG: hypothetical protein PHO30_00075 [Candidatus Omnitrophica bacterium]|nr:hypothetical protein [Candidatus Omnitrophota bacterium]
MEKLTFEEWISWIFNHEVVKPAWFYGINAPFYELNHDLSVQYVTRLFQEAGEKLSVFSDEQVNQGLYFLIDPGASGIICQAVVNDVELNKVRELIFTINNIYSNIFFKRCTPYLSHLNESGVGALNPVCYMWWDVSAFGSLGRNTNSEESILEACLETMRKILELPHDACRESALHGLGHLVRMNRKKTLCQHLIAEFLRNNYLRQELRDYAKAAQNGTAQ